jgi:hypothetical protein
MANPIYCDAGGCEERADRMISDINTGEVLAFCSEHFVAFCIDLARVATEEIDAEVNGPAPAPNGRRTRSSKEDAAEPEPKSEAEAEVAAVAEGAGDAASSDTAPDD